MSSSKFEGLLCRLEKLEVHLTSKVPRKSEDRPSVSKQRRFISAIHPSTSTLNARTSGSDAATISGLLGRLEAAEQQYVRDKASLTLQLQKERQRTQRAEAAARRAEDQRDFRLSEARHLKNALKSRDDQLTLLQDRLTELESQAICAAAIEQATAERDEMQAALIETREKAEKEGAAACSARSETAAVQERFASLQRDFELEHSARVRAEKEAANLRARLRDAERVADKLEQGLTRHARQAADRATVMERLVVLGELLGGE